MNHTIYVQGVSDLNVKIDIEKGSSVPSNHKFFSPSTITIDKGVTVKWINKDSTLHTITSGKPQSSDTGVEFDSSYLAAGSSFEYTFDNAGTYNYFCTLHPFMKGKVVVSTNTGIIKTAEKQTPETIDTSFDSNTNVTQLPTSNITADDFATAADTEGAPDTEGISFKIQLKPHSNKFLADQGYYELAKSINGITNSSTICASTADCKFVLTEGQMNPRLIGFDEYTFSGRAKITTSVDGDASRSKFYDINADLKVFEEKTNGSKTIRFLQGDLNLEPGALDYQITKALLFSDNKRKLTLTVEGEGTPSGNGIDTSSADTSSADTSSGNILKNTDKTANKIMNQADKTIEKINKLFK